MKKLTFIVLITIFAISIDAQIFNQSNYPYSTKIQLIESELKIERSHQIDQFNSIEELKSGKATKDILESLIDSTVTYVYASPTDSTHSSKIISHYNQFGDDTLEIRYTWDADTYSWNNSRMYTYSYNENNDLLLSITYEWDEINTNWLNNSKNVLNYDTFRNVILSAYYYWDSEKNNWRGSFKNEYAYDENGHQTLYVRYIWDDELYDWIGYYKSESTFGNDGYPQLSYEYSWLNNDWNLDYKREYAFENTLLSLVMQYQMVAQDWEKYLKEEYTYDANENLLSMRSYLWKTGDIYENSTLDQYTYDDDNNRTSSSYFSWDTELNSWVGTFKRTSIFDENGNLTLYTRYNWDDEAMDWVYNSKWESTFNENGFEVLWEYFKWSVELDIWEGKYREEYSVNDYGDWLSYAFYLWDEYSDDWLLDSKTFYYYTFTPDEIKETYETQLVTYPNPSSGLLTIAYQLNESATVEIILFNQLGDVVKMINEYQNNGSQKVSLNMTELPSGTYYFKIKVGSQTGTGKVVLLN